MNKFFHLLISLIIGLFSSLIAIAVGLYALHLYQVIFESERDWTMFDFVLPLGIVAIIGCIGIPMFSTIGYFLITKFNKKYE